MIIKHIQAGGKLRPFLFSYRAIRELANTDLTAADADDELEVMSYLGFKYGAIKQAKHQNEKAVLDFKPSDVADWFEEDLNSFLEVQQALQEMEAFKEKMQAPQNKQQKRSRPKK